jgi:asparagine synthase (glutamine-hydrolysing)
LCGIAGFWQSKQGPEDPREILERMGTALARRGPDDCGYLWDSSTGLGFAHRRLAILDLTAEGHQPMRSASGRYAIVFNGEIFNFQEIRAELENVAWRGHCDTEVMLEAFDRWGLDAALRRFVGMFAFALWDYHERKLWLVRDRLGIKPLYYGRVHGDFVFASELKAVWKYPAFEGAINRDALALYMRHNYVPSPHCIYRDMRKLQPGCILELSAADREPAVRSFWSALDAARQGLQAPLAGKDEELVEELHQRLKAAVGLRMIADVPLGVFLSGGIDSSLVVALMQAQSSRPVKTFTIGFQEGGYNEARHAKAVAERLGTEHTELYVTPQDALNVVPMLPGIYDEPFADSSQIPTYLVSKLARSRVTVSLSGDGGDELFAGYNRYLFAKRLWQSLSRLPTAAQKLAAAAIHSFPPAEIDRAYGYVRPLLPRKHRWLAVGDKAHKLADFFPCDSPEAIYLQALSHSSVPSGVVLNAREPDTVPQVMREGAWLENFEDRMMLTDLRTYLPDDILTKVDRASMAVSLEARVPLLDHRLVEFAWRLPLGVKIRHGASKWILRQILYRYVPRQMIERPKMGFAMPIEHWLRGPLREWAEGLLPQESLRHPGLLNTEAVLKMWREHLSGARNWQGMLWNVLVFQQWYLHAKTQLSGSSPDEPLPGGRRADEGRMVAAA